METCILKNSNKSSKINTRHTDGERSRTMTREEAARYIEKLSYEERYKLNEMLKALAQKHPLSQVLPESGKPIEK